MTPAPSPQTPQRPHWIAPVVLVLTLLTGAGLHYWPGPVTVRPMPRPIDKPTRAVVNKPASPKPMRAKPGYPARNTRVASSEFCADCELYYSVHDGHGGKRKRSGGYTARCCPCGSTVAFSDGYYYEIICEGEQITAKMGKRVSDPD